MSEPATLIAWSDHHRIGIDEIDREHEWMARDFNTVVNILRTIRDRRLIEKTFESFFRSTAGHFANEEAAMLEAGFDDLEVHRERHQNYLARLAGLRDKMRGGANVSTDLMGFYSSWLTHHVSVTDQKFGEFLKARR